MLRWEFVLKADDDRDLTDPAAAARWLDEFYDPPADPRARGHGAVLLSEPTILDEWVLRVRALRSLAGRLRRRQTRLPGLASGRADWVFKQNLRRIGLQPDIRPPAPGKTRNGLLTAADFRGVTFDFAIFSPHDYPGVGPIAAMSADLLDVLWRMVFASLAAVDVPLVCGRCGKDLPPTRSGRPSRSQLCPPCRHKAWREAQDGNAMRARWRQDQRAKRARERGEA